jgi:hypothetical protein
VEIGTNSIQFNKLNEQINQIVTFIIFTNKSPCLLESRHSRPQNHPFHPIVVNLRISLNPFSNEADRKIIRLMLYQNPEILENTNLK